MLTLSIIGNFYQGISYNTEKEKEEIKYTDLTSQYEDINELYDESLALVDEFKADNHQLGEELTKQVQELKSLKQEIEHIKSTVKDKSRQLKELRLKYARVVSLNKGLEEKIDEILLENKTLYEKNDSLEENVLVLTEEKSSLGKKITDGSKIKAEYVVVSTFKKRSSGKYKETLMAKRANKVEVSFTLLENPISEKGEKRVYLRILSPDGVELGNPLMGSDEFKITGTDSLTKFSVKKDYTYTGENQEMTISYEEESEEIEFDKGMYRVEIYVETYLSGRGSFYLK